MRLVPCWSDASPLEGAIESRDPAAAIGIVLPELRPLTLRPPLRPPTTLRPAWSSPGHAKCSEFAAILLPSGINSYMGPLESNTCPLCDPPPPMVIGVSIPAGWQTGRLADWQTSRRADERVGLGLKGHIPRGPLHSWAPSPLASSERERAGCLGVQWSPARLHVKHLYLAPGLACLV